MYFSIIIRPPTQNFNRKNKCARIFASLNVFAADTAVTKTFSKGLVKIEATGASAAADVTGAGITWQLVNDGTASNPGINTPADITVTGDVVGKVTIDVNGVSGASIFSGFQPLCEQILKFLCPVELYHILYPPRLIIKIP